MRQRVRLQKKDNKKEKKQKRERTAKYDGEKGVGNTRCSGTGLGLIVHL
jgi:hypothetical protein